MADVKDTDKGWAKITLGLQGFNGLTLNVGVLGDAAGFVRGAGGAGNIVDIATWNEFGTMPRGSHPGSPARSFLRSTFDEKLDTNVSQLKKAVAETRNPAGVDKAVRRLGLRMQRDIRRKIVTLKKPPNAPSTIAAKGSSNPLIDTGRLRQSINFEVVEASPLEQT